MKFKKSLLIIFFTIIVQSLFCQEAITTRTANNIRLKIPYLQEFNLLDSAIAANLNPGKTFNVATFYIGEDFRDDIVLYTVKDVNTAISVSRFSDWKVQHINNFKNGKIIEGNLPIEKLESFVEQFYANKPDTLKIMKDKISTWTMDTLKFTIINSKIIFNNSQGLIIGYDFSCKCFIDSIRNNTTTYTGMFLLKNRYFGFAGSMYEEPLLKSKFEQYIKEFASNLIALNK